MARLSLCFFTAHFAKWPARQTVLAALAISQTTMIASCVTPTPDFREPPQSPPFLLAEGANPSLQEILVIEPAKYPHQEFSAFVRSEDAGHPVNVRLLVDYGRLNIDGVTPYQESQNGNALDAASIDETSRLAKVPWVSKNVETSACHTFTLIVSHAFNETTACPVDSRDSSSITWMAYVCGPNESPCQFKVDPNDASKNCVFDSGKAPSFCPKTDGSMTSSTGAGQ